ncbi:unnamed protein product [Aphis gossypii]|uniref:Uncharacterized protein n=1 Tax=Aphis gossypii TaxID=80765 RepID=A0A9P0J537_APHGO|nr:unnamed protein product [Aphis gossypii]
MALLIGEIIHRLSQPTRGRPVPRTCAAHQTPPVLVSCANGSYSFIISLHLFKFCIFLRTHASRTSPTRHPPTHYLLPNIIAVDRSARDYASGESHHFGSRVFFLHRAAPYRIEPHHSHRSLSWSGDLTAHTRQRPSATPASIVDRFGTGAISIRSMTNNDDDDTNNVNRARCRHRCPRALLYK